MTIIQDIQFLYNLFPEVKDDEQKLIEAVKRYYSVGPFEPQISSENDQIHITLDVDRVEADKKKYAKLISLAENHNYEEAKTLAKELIEGAPNISEYHRVLGQIYSETGDQESAVDSLIDALRWNPKNEYALIMMGNVYARYKKDVDTAMTFYNEVLSFRPDDYLSLNNIGVQLMEAGNLNEARRAIEKAHKANPDYPNTLYALALLLNKEENNNEAFNFAIRSIKKNPKKDELYSHSVSLALQIAKKLADVIDPQYYVNDFISELKIKTGTDILMRAEDSISTAATIQYAEIYNRDHHLILYQPGHPGVEHLIIHELTHLALAHEARQEGKQKLFTSNPSAKSKFFMNFRKEREKLKKQGIAQEQADKFMESLYDGLNSQLFNTPIDLFIEDRIYNRFEELRPLQFLSIYTIIRQGIDANTRPDIIKFTPSKVLTTSITYNLVNSFHFRDLYGVDLIADHNPRKTELNKARALYEEYQEYRQDKEPGEEYELIQFWAEDLNVDHYFELIDEQDRQSKSAESILDDIERDPYGLDEMDPSRERKMKQFIEAHGDEDTNMAVAMYMADALGFFERLPQEEIKKIAFEIAHIGMTGIDPKKSGYKIPSIRGSSFSGYKTLAYYYVSWALAVPEMLSQLQMPFENEYKIAKQLKQM